MKKKKSKKKSGLKDKSAKETEDEIKTLTQGYKLEDSGTERDTRTAAEKAYDARMKKRVKEEVSKGLAKTQKDRVHEFNEKLAKLSEHNDIPKVDGSW